ncbi:WXG100 family type VII secretion target [Streptomyces sp. Tu6071]|uniref:WXG100 family type VII secretion target n=1 Tax=Streptomyces sp. Tu6071 TaxID=355249 RepID=UPI00030C9760|nr:WXG100 family type VII secretion target [Streptomyces sp. Tu6071]
MAEEITFEEFKADLAELRDTLGYVRTSSQHVNELMDDIDTAMKSVGDDWHSPAFGTFDEITNWFHRCQEDLRKVLADIITKMQTSYDNYHAAEEKNERNLHGEGGGGADG